MTHYLGVDPGVTGALACIGDDLSILTLEDMPPTVHDLVAALRDISMTWGGISVVIEQQQSMPRDGHQAAFKTGQGFGRLEGVLAGLGIPYQFVRPADWKRTFGLTFSKDSKLSTIQQKNASRALAQQRFPTADLRRVKDHGRAEALLLALWLLEKERKA